MRISNHSQYAVPWEGSTRLPVTSATLDMLFAGELAALCVPDFLTPEECAGLSKRVEECEFKDYLNVVPRIKKIGITVFEFDGIGKKHYFEEVESANHSIMRITADICSPLQRAIDWLANLSPNRKINIAHEPGLGLYFAGLARRIEEGTLIHVDFAPMEQPTWAVAQVQNQLAFNIYLDISRVSPGVVRIWQKHWQLEDQRFKIFDSYGYAAEVVGGIPSVTVTPRAGMMVLINTRNFHQVSETYGRRLTFSASVGQLSDKNLVVWS
jgi:hypothetical protein